MYLPFIHQEYIQFQRESDDAIKRSLRVVWSALKLPPLAEHHQQSISQVGLIPLTAEESLQQTSPSSSSRNNVQSDRIQQHHEHCLIPSNTSGPIDTLHIENDYAETQTRKTVSSSTVPQRGISLQENCTILDKALLEKREENLIRRRNSSFIEVRRQSSFNRQNEGTLRRASMNYDVEDRENDLHDDSITGCNAALKKDSKILDHHSAKEKGMNYNESVKRPKMGNRPKNVAAIIPINNPICQQQKRFDSRNSRSRELV